MLNTIRLKIIVMAMALMALLAAATGLATYLNKQVLAELLAIAEINIPLGTHVSSIDVLTFELELHILRGIEKSPLDPSQIVALRQRHMEIIRIIRNDFKHIRRTLEIGISDPRNDLEDQIVFAELKGAFASLDQRIEPFLQIGVNALAAIEAGDLPRARVLAQGFRAFEDVFGKDLLQIRRGLENMTLSSFNETNRNQDNVLWLNAALFAVVAALGLALFLALANRLHRSLEDLLTGTQQVENGQLDVKLAVNSDDQIGRLTRSFNHMIGQLKEKERIKDTFGKYVDPRIVARLIAAQDDNENVSERRPATIFFSDIKNFTGMSERLTASAMVNLLNSYFSIATREIREQHGIIDKFIGDSVMAFWTAPFSAADQHAADACLAALAQREAIAKFCGELPQITGLRRDPPDFAVRMGIATGEVVIGTIGSEITKSYTVIGDAVNVASRLEGANKVYGTNIIIDETTFRLAQGSIEARELDLLTTVGKIEPQRIYQLLCSAGELPTDMVEVRELFAAGLAAYRAHDWDTAERRFDECLALRADDGPADVFRRRLKLLRTSPPPADWDGVWRLTEK